MPVIPKRLYKKLLIFIHQCLHLPISIGWPLQWLHQALVWLSWKQAGLKQGWRSSSMLYEVNRHKSEYTNRLSISCSFFLFTYSFQVIYHRQITQFDALINLNARDEKEKKFQWLTDVLIGNHWVFVIETDRNHLWYKFQKDIVTTSKIYCSELFRRVSGGPICHRI